MKIGLVTPYIYPLPGGVNAHVHDLYEHLVARGHDVRIISSTHGPQRSSEGDIIRLGYGFSVPTNGSVGTLTFSPRYGELVSDDARPRALRHPAFPRAVRAVPVAPAAAPLDTASTSPPSTPTPAGARRTSSANACSSASRAACTAASPSAPRRATSSIATSRATTRSSPTASTCALHSARTVRALPGRHAQHPLHRPVRARKGVMYLLKAYRQLRRAASTAGCWSPAPGPQEREVRRYIATRRLTGVELLGRISDADKSRSSPPPTSSLAGDGPGIVGHRAARGDGRGNADRVQRHPRLQGRRAARRAGAARAAARMSKALADAHRHAAARPGACASGWAQSGASAPSSSAGRTSPPRSTTTTSS